MAFCFEHDDGWLPLVTWTAAQLAAVARETGCACRVIQVKEKFAALTMYYRVDDACPADVRNRLTAIVDGAARLSALTCERYGRPGRCWRGWGDWLKTLCGACAARWDPAAVPDPWPRRR